MFIKKANELTIGQSVQYIGNTCNHFGEFFTVKEINEEKNQVHISNGDKYLSRCDVENILVVGSPPITTHRTLGSSPRKRRTGRYVNNFIVSMDEFIVSMDEFNNMARHISFSREVTAASLTHQLLSMDDIPFYG